MPDRVTVGRIITGHGSDRKTIAPGSRINTDSLGLSPDEVKAMDASGVLRRPRDPNTNGAPAAGPREEPVAERRVEAAEVAEERRVEADEAVRRATRRRPADLDEL